MAKNYIEHEISVKFMDQYYSKGIDWQWFINIIESDFDFVDVSTWKEYENQCWRWAQLYSYLIKIVECGPEELDVEQPMLRDLYYVAQFDQGVIDTDEVSKLFSSVFGKVFFWVVWATKLEKQDNDIQLLYDNDLFKLRNMWQSRSLVTLELYSDEVLSYGKSIPLADIEEHISCLKDNIDKIFFKPQNNFSELFLDIYPEEELFGYQSAQMQVITLQERIVVGLINNRIDRFGKYPIENIFGNDTKEEICNKLEEIKTYFTSHIVDYIVETVLFIWIGKEPSINSKAKYCGLWTKICKTEEHYKRFDSVSFWCISYLFSKGMVAKLRDLPEYKEFIDSLHMIDDYYDLQRLIENKFPLSNEQKNIIKTYRESAYKEIDSIEDPHIFKDYINNDTVCKSIDTQYFCKVRDKFLYFIDDETIHRLLPNYFYDFMVFLLNTKNKSRSVLKKEIDITIIKIQELWSEKYYDIACQDLHSFGSKVEVPNEEIIKYNENILINPFSLAQICMNLSPDNLCSIMERASEHAISYMVTRMSLSRTYPVKNDSINLYRHDVDGFLDEYINKIREEKSYRFLNQLDNSKYLLAIYEDIHLKSRMFISMFNKEKDIYESLAKQSDVELIPLNDKLLLAHVTQLFPILEQRIRAVASIFGVAPFKENMNDFMLYKDPSSLLREMIEEYYKETGDFELIYDLMFVYCFMYNSNSFNIRNECIHGRAYNKDNDIFFAFKVTLLSIHMINYRIEVVTKNVNE